VSCQMLTAVLILLVTIVTGKSATIYPDGHWDRCTKLTQQNFDQEIKNAVNSDKTLFVRWIASEGWGWWRKQAPAWNQAVELFAHSADVAFGDVLLSSDSIRGAPHNPGQGGWPTIRYFNKETGIEGANYQKKTDKSMCEELGEIDNMVAYIEDKGRTSLCNVETKVGCSEKLVVYIEKFKAEGKDKINAELDRLQKLHDQPMKPEAKFSFLQRMNILKKLSEVADREDL